MRPTDILKNDNLENWEAATDHAFCRELADGSLPLEKMRWYLVQDYKFIGHFVRLLASAIAHAPTLADSVPAAQFLGLITGKENTYFLRSFEALEISEHQQNSEAAPSTIKFQNLMHEARMSGRYEQMIAVLLVAEWSYLTWGERYTDYADDLPFWFAEWIDLHSGEGFEGVVNYLRDQLDSVWDGLSEQERQDAARMFKAAVDCEKDFFDASYASA